MNRVFDYARRKPWQAIAIIVVTLFIVVFVLVPLATLKVEIEMPPAVAQ